MHRALLLDKNYMVLSIVTWKKAIKLNVLIKKTKKQLKKYQDRDNKEKKN